MEYLVNGEKFILKYPELVNSFNEFKSMNDAEFMSSLPAAIHFACIVCYLKEVPSYLCLSDVGIIHELAHLIHIPDESKKDLKRIRELFNTRLALSR